jgi:predicted negative regulator of RcsB-dependent stress response
VLLGEMERDYSSSPYLDQAKLVVAKVYVENGELDKAASELQSVVQNSKDKDLALLARTRLARVQIAQKKFDDALATLNVSDTGAFAPIFHEVRGDAYHAKGNNAGALTEYRAARDSDVAGAPDSQLLDLKIADLPAEASGSTSKPTQPPAAAAAK